MIKRIYLFIALTLTLSISFNSCDKSNDGNPSDTSKYTYGNGVFIVNEGTFGQGNASISFLNKDFNILYEEVFANANNRPLGDIAQSMQIYKGLGFIVVNNSGTIEVVNVNSFKSIATISNLSSPRNVLILDDSKGYITHLSQGKITIINPTTYAVTGEINTVKSCENILQAGGKVFTTNWSDFFVPGNNNTVLVIDPATDQVTDSIMVGKEPNSMVLDKNNKIWVLCSGGFMNDEIPSLYKIDPLTLTVESRFDFPLLESSPGKLCTNGIGDVLYFLNPGVFRMPIESQEIPGTPFIDNPNAFFYSMGVDPKGETTYLSDAIDFNQKGIVYRYNVSGTLTRQVSGGIVPGAFYFAP